MLVFIDESGDPGFKVDSSPSLVLAMAIFDIPEEADEARKRIEQLGKKAVSHQNFDSQIAAMR